MTREFRLMLAEQGAADAELMGAGVTAPKSAAEALREMAADLVATHDEAVHGGGDRTLVKRIPDHENLINSAFVVAIRNLPIPADPRDAEIERLRDVVKRAAKYVCPYDGVGGTISPSAATVSLLADIRAALAQCGEAGK